MVKRYAGGFEKINGRFVEYDDYQSIRTALEEALEEWQAWMPTKRSSSIMAAKGRIRIAELRKQFLGI